MYYFRIVLTILILFAFSICHANDNQPFAKDTDQFTYAELIYKQGYFKVAVREFGKVIRDYPLSDLIGNAHYMTAVSYMKSGNQKEALAQFEQFLENFPKDDIALDVKIKIHSLKDEDKIEQDDILLPPQEIVTLVTEEAVDLNINMVEQDGIILPSQEIAILAHEEEVEIHNNMVKQDDILSTHQEIAILVPKEVIDLTSNMVEQDGIFLPPQEMTTLVPEVALELHSNTVMQDDILLPPQETVTLISEKEIELNNYTIKKDDLLLPSQEVSMLLPKEEVELHENEFIQSLTPQDLPILAPEGNVKLHAVQVSVFKGRDFQEIGAEFDVLKNAGIDTIIVRVFHNSGDTFYRFVSPSENAGVYFKTKYAPVVGDILGKIIEIAHKRGIKVFAWMTTKYANYGIEDRYDLTCKGYDIQLGTQTICKGLDLFNEASVEHLEGLYADLADYEIDGILFQDDLVLRHTSGFGRHAESLYKKEIGLELRPETLYTLDDEGHVQYTPEFWRWAAWKNKRLLTVARRLKAVTVKKRPNVKFAINLMYEALSNPRYGLAWLSQSLEEAVKEDFDYYAVMAYHRQMGEELGLDHDETVSLIEEMTAKAVSIVNDPTKILMKLQTIDWSMSTPISNEEIITIIKRIRNTKGISLAVFPYRSNFPFHALADNF